MSLDIAGVQDKLKEIPPLALYTHCYSHCRNLFVAASSKVQEVRNLIGFMNEAHLFLYHSSKWQRMFELTLHEYLPNSSSHSRLTGLYKTRWVEQHTCYAIFHEMFEVLITFLDAILFTTELFRVSI